MKIKEKIIHKGKWLQFSEVSFKDNKDIERSWETIRRNGNNHAVTILAIDSRKAESPQVVCIRQFRPSVNNYVIELPAGLIDHKEKPEIAAQRELLEETGFKGEVISVGPLSLNSPGMSSEGTHMVTVQVFEKVEASLERDEDIETILIPINDLQNHLLELEQQGNHIDAKIWSLATGLKLNQLI